MKHRRNSLIIYQRSDGLGQVVNVQKLDIALMYLEEERLKNDSGALEQQSTSI